jgi:hypothetical protein
MCPQRHRLKQILITNNFSCPTFNCLKDGYSKKDPNMNSPDVYKGYHKGNEIYMEELSSYQLHYK